MFDEHAILMHLPPFLKNNVSNYMAHEYFGNLSLFSHIHPYVLGLLALKLKSISCNSQHYLFHKSQFGQEIYIVKSGISLMEYSPHDSNSNNSYRILKRGDLFGSNIFINTQRDCTVKSITYSEYFVLTVADLLDTLKNNFGDNYTVIYEQIISKAKLLADKELSVSLNYSKNCPMHGPKVQIKNARDQLITSTHNQCIQSNKPYKKHNRSCCDMVKENVKYKLNGSSKLRNKMIVNEFQKITLKDEFNTDECTYDVSERLMRKDPFVKLKCTCKINKERMKTIVSEIELVSEEVKLDNNTNINTSIDKNGGSTTMTDDENGKLLDTLTSNNAVIKDFDGELNDTIITDKLNYDVGWSNKKLSTIPVTKSGNVYKYHGN